jgi:hypothetical protein
MKKAFGMYVSNVARIERVSGADRSLAGRAEHLAQWAQNRPAPNGGPDIYAVQSTQCLISDPHV